MARTGSAYGLTSPRGADWRDTAACRADGFDPDLMFPDNSTVGIAKAKQVCMACPVRVTCLRDAIQAGDDQWGIRGGMKPEERRRLAKKAADVATSVPRISGKVRTKRAPASPPRVKEGAPKTLTEAFERRIEHTPDGHVRWYGAKHMKFQGGKWTALQVAFKVGYGRDPEGYVLRTCDEECFLAEHLTDAVVREERAVCGTLAGYYRHIKNGEPTCAPCRSQNAAADRRLRTTGTTKVAV